MWKLFVMTFFVSWGILICAGIVFHIRQEYRIRRQWQREMDKAAKNL
jgi:hypothetical protein